MVGYVKESIIFVTGAGAIALIYFEQFTAGVSLLTSLLGYYAGEQVGKRETS